MCCMFTFETLAHGSDAMTEGFRGAATAGVLTTWKGCSDSADS